MIAKKTKSNIALDDEVKYGLSDIEILEFNIKQIKEDELDHDNLSGNLSVKGEYDEIESVVHVVIGVDIQKIDKNSSTNHDLIGTLIVKYTYAVFGLEKLQDDEGGILPKTMVDTFNAISISTTRGILFTKFQATKLNDFILPLIDHRKFTKDYIE